MSFKELELDVGPLDFQADDGFLEAMLSFTVSVPMADVWQVRSRPVPPVSLGALPHQLGPLGRCIAGTPPSGTSGILGCSTSLSPPPWPKSGRWIPIRYLRYPWVLPYTVTVLVAMGEVVCRVRHNIPLVLLARLPVAEAKESK